VARVFAGVITCALAHSSVLIANTGSPPVLLSPSPVPSSGHVGLAVRPGAELRGLKGEPCVRRGGWAPVRVCSARDPVRRPDSDSEPEGSRRRAPARRRRLRAHPSPPRSTALRLRCTATPARRPVRVKGRRRTSPPGQRLPAQGASHSRLAQGPPLSGPSPSPADQRRRCAGTAQLFNVGQDSRSPICAAAQRATRPCSHAQSCCVCNVQTQARRTHTLTRAPCPNTFPVATTQSALLIQC
jgi:hypothetical protein